MWLLFVEAGVALFLMVFIVWWTMFAGRKPNPPAKRDDTPQQERQDLGDPKN